MCQLETLGWDLFVYTFILNFHSTLLCVHSKTDLLFLAVATACSWKVVQGVSMIVPTLEDIWNFPYFQSIFSATVEQWIEKILFLFAFYLFLSDGCQSKPQVKTGKEKHQGLHWNPWHHSLGNRGIIHYPNKIIFKVFLVEKGRGDGKTGWRVFRGGKCQGIEICGKNWYIIIMIIIINKNVFLFSAKRELSLWCLTAADSGKRWSKLVISNF